MKVRHQNELHEMGVLKCGVCDDAVIFETVNQHHRHMKEAHGIASQYECYICKVQLNTFSDANRHSQLHVQARSEQCTVCNEMWTPKEFNRHICVRGTSIQCEYCTKSFGATVKLIRHIESEHEKEQILHRCDKCHRFFVMALLRDVHVMQHREVSKNYVCNICSKAFSTKYRYECHRECCHSTTSMH